MGYRLLVVVCSLMLVCACAAFDSSQGENFEGFAPSEVPAPPAGGQGVYAGYYIGTRTLGSNSCASVTDEVGASSPVEFEVIHLNTIINLVFDDGAVSAGSLEDESSTFLVENLGVRNIYLLTFGDGSVEGSQEVYEQDESGQYKDACASYTIQMEIGEKPEEEGKEESADEKAVPIAVGFK